MKPCLLLILLALAVPSPAMAGDPVVPQVRYSADYDQCVAQDDSSAHMNDCLEDEQTRAEAELNAAWRETMARLSPARRASLRAEERQWITRREETCEAIYQEMNEGNGAGAAQMDCLTRFAIARAAELRRLR